MPRFVILEHDYPRQHWDLMLESGEVLRTWRLLAVPQPGQAVVAEALGDHRKLYLDYEGPVSGGRGTVRRWDAGDFHWLSVVEPLVFVLQGQRLRGSVRLERASEGCWIFTLT